MTLPSQFARPTSRHTHMFRRRRNGRKAFLIVLIGLLVVSLTVWRLFGSGGDTPAVIYAGGDDLSEQSERQPQRSAADAPRDESNRDVAMRSALAKQVSPSEVSPAEPRIEMGAPLSQSPRQSEPTTPSTSSSNAASSSQASQSERTSEQESTTREQSRQASTSASRAEQRMRAGMDMLASNRPIEGRQMLTQALNTSGLSNADARRIRQTLTELNERLVFSPEVVPDDPFAFGYTIRPGDALSRLPRAQNVATDWRLIQRINRIQRPQAIRAGQNIKLVTGPFHAVVYKRQYRMDVYMGDGSQRVYVRSFPVGLGEYDSTPVGTFKVRPNSKLINPEWTNPRTGERFLPDDPNNPIGDYWIGLVGVSDGIQDLGGYGIHGTIEPNSIGQQASMGCIRLLDEDVALVYELLVEDHSTIEIVDE